MNTKYLAALKIPIVVLCLLGAGLAAYLFVYVTHQTDYLVGRDFRLLATIGNQIEESIANDRRVLSNLFLLQTKWLVDTTLRDERIRQADFVPILSSAKIVAWPEQGPKTRSKSGQSDTGVDVLLLQFLERDSLATWIRREESPTVKRSQAIVQLGLDDLLAPLLKREAQRGIFDVLLVAANDGRVVFQAEDQKARITRLDTLTNQSDPKNPSATKFEDLARAPAMVDVVVSGARYKLFTWPCCGSMSVGSEATTRNNNGWVIGGLVAERSLAAESHAASFSIMACVLAVLLLTGFSWPFLKLSLVGETQRVKAHDVVLVGLGALLGMALLTVSVLDLLAYHRLEAVLDEQLQGFAEEISQKARGEIASAYDELTRLEDVAGSSTQLSQTGIGNLATNALFKAGDFDAYPFFDSFSILDEHGFQSGKLTFSSFVPPLIDVNDREYFTYWRSAHPAQVFLQPVQSATTGAREAVLSKVLSKRVPGKLEVATLSIPLRALIDPVIAPGFGFAIIGQDGRVLFHSDRQHRLSENFFVESDRSRRLRSLVAAKRTEWLDFKYWGDDHRAFVAPMDPVIERPGHSRVVVAPMDAWTIVAFYDKDLIRAVNVEWLVLAVMFVAAYAGVYVTICLGLLVVRPKYRAPWLWPDPARSKAYLDLFAPLFLLSAASVVAIAVLSHSDLLFFAFLLPFLAWAVAYITLTDRAAWPGLVRPVVIELCLAVPLLILALRAEEPVWRGVLAGLVAAGAGWPVVVAWAAWRRTSSRRSPLAPPVAVSYGVAAVLLLLLTTVLPAAAFFRIGHGVQIESFIKYGELQSELQRIERERAEADAAKQFLPTYETLSGLRAHSPDWGMYDTFFAPHSRQAASAGACVEERRSALPEEVEEVLPFYSESSVLMRELVHDQAADKSWGWRRCGAVLEFHRPAGGPVAARWVVPAFFEPTTDGGTAFLYLGLGAVIVGALLVWLMRFMLRKIFLVDVIEPLWSGGGEPLRDLWGPHLFLVSGTPLSAELHVPGYCEVDLTSAPAREAQEGQWFADQLQRIKHAPAGQNVLILHFEHGIMDRAFNERKLALLEGIVDVLNRTVVVVSAAAASLFTASNAARWSRLLSRFTVVPVAPAADAPTPQAASSMGSGALLGELRHAGWREILWRITALGFAHNTKFLGDECRDPTIGRFWRDVLPFAWHPDRPPLDVEQLLVEVGDRAENYYQEIWATCTPVEKLVLGQIAEEGLVNPRTARTVRMLMARGLVRRQPHFLLMNESFRQFVVSSVPRREVQSLEGQSPSSWDSVRWPFIILLGSALAFFFATQHELFNTTLGVIAGVGAAVPALVKIAGIFGDRQSTG